MSSDYNLNPNAVEFVPSQTSVSPHRMPSRSTSLQPTQQQDSRVSSSSIRSENPKRKQRPKPRRKNVRGASTSDQTEKTCTTVQEPKEHKPRRRNRNRRKPKVSSEVDDHKVADNKQHPAQQLSTSKTSKPKFQKGRSKTMNKEQTLQEQFNNGKYVCPSCFHTTPRKQPIWCCENCQAVQHFSCVKKWKQQHEGEPFTCPFCRHEYKKLNPPSCFCGRTPHKELHGFNAHSCGETCGRKLKCEHKCPDACHPGACKPCTTMVSVTCFCSKTTATMQCTQAKKGFSCGEVCNNMLQCGKHFCEKHCHAGDCEPCTIQTIWTCGCGKETLTLNCPQLTPMDREILSSKSLNHQCLDLCHKPLGCGHVCKSKCHLGQCPPCWRAPQILKTCCCGKTQVPDDMRQSCTDALPTCDQQCQKKLDCGHYCQQLCHEGDCPPCTVSVDVLCRCGSKTLQVPCHNRHHVLCDKVCKVKLSCKRNHRCNTQCCPFSNLPNAASLHMCTRKCSRVKSCGKCRCTLDCHPGKCPPCREVISTEPVYCTCGKTCVMPPIYCTTADPVCHELCSLTRPCGHTDSHTCHPESEPCPPCAVLVKKPCSGGHGVLVTVPCHVTSVSCKNICNKQLACKLHCCPAPCHSGPCPVPPPPKRHVLDSSLTSNPRSCGYPCGKERSCGHACPALCHPGEDCPKSVPCNEPITSSCKCGAQIRTVRCHDMILVSDSGLYAPCNQQCAKIARERKMLERNRSLADALKIDNPNLTSQLEEQYSPFLQEQAQNNHELIKTLEQKLEGMVITKTKFMVFGVMNRTARQTLHELAEHYLIRTVSVDQEPHRSVNATLTSKSAVPRPKLSEKHSPTRKVFW